MEHYQPSVGAIAWACLGGFVLLVVVGGAIGAGLAWLGNHGAF